MNRLCSEKRRGTEKKSSTASFKRFKGDRWSTDDETNEEFSSASNSDDDEFSSRSMSIVNEFEEISRENSRKTFDLTRCSTNETKEKWKFQLRNTFDRDDLLSEGYGVICEKEFPFFSICFMCGSLGNDLIYCNSCCQAFHPNCLNVIERPRFRPTAEFWSCPNCVFCSICGLTTVNRSKSPSICCFQCKKHFHLRCLTSNSFSVDPQQRWSCSTCLKCDCGRSLSSNEENLLPKGKSFQTQRSLMCSSCVEQLKKLRSKMNFSIDKCHFCQRFIEHLFNRRKSLFTAELIGPENRSRPVFLFQCQQCQHRFHPLCDGFLNEDTLLLVHLPTELSRIVCSRCDKNRQDQIRTALIQYKTRTVKKISENVQSLLNIMIADETRALVVQRSMFNLQQLHQSLEHSLNLHAFFNDLLILVQSFLSHLEPRQWQAAIGNCILTECSSFQWSNSNTFLCSSTIGASISSTSFVRRCCQFPSIDHNYSLTEEHLRSKIDLYQTNLLNSTDSLLDFLKNFTDEQSSWENLHRIDTRQCEICCVYADQFASNISRLIPIGIDCWAHAGCLLPLFSKTLQQPPYVLQNVKTIIEQCRTNSFCEFCSMPMATIPCGFSKCSTHFHRHCLEKHNIPLVNFKTFCSKHEQVQHPDSPGSIEIFSPIYSDLSNEIVDLNLDDLRVCVGSLRIHSLGNFDYLTNHPFDPNKEFYPDGYCASRVFWSTKNVREKTIYHLTIRIEQTYHQEQSNHQTIEYPLSPTQRRLEQLYRTAADYFQRFSSLKHRQIPRANQPDRMPEILSIDTKTLRNIFARDQNDSKNFSPLAKALLDALHRIDHNENLLQIDGSNDVLVKNLDELLIDLYEKRIESIVGRVRFIIISDDGQVHDESQDLDHLWSTIVDRVRACRDEMHLTHLPMNSPALNGHQTFGLSKSIVKQLLRQKSPRKASSFPVNLSLSTSRSSKKNKNQRGKIDFSISRLIIYQRKDQRRQRFAWLTNSTRNIQYAVQMFDIDHALDYVRKILLHEPSVNLRLHCLRYFSQRALIVGRSSIHGCGLFTLIDLIEGQMLIEYTGEIIRPSLTDKRERRNEENGFGCYMFTVDSMNVIDATHQGNKARFINHHCQPNCFAKTVYAAGKKHIVIYASTNISRGSELTYDYSFPEEEIKIPCHCGTSQCRMYLN